MLSLLLPVASALLIFAGSLTSHKQEPELYINSVNTILGDISYEKEFGFEPHALASEETRIKTHLQYVINILEHTAIKHLNADQVRNRKNIISLLKGYTEAGQFPKNHHYKNRRPVFIDRDGNLCAVGYLIARTEGLEAAKQINQHHKFDYIQDIDPKLIDGWLAENGITKTEAAMIQPAYDFNDPEPKRETFIRNNIETEYAIGSSILAGAQIGISAYMLFNGNNIGNKNAHLFNAALGATSFTLGLINLDNSESQTQRICGTIPPCWDQEIVIKNQSRTNLSVSNIILGGAFAAFNTYQFFKTSNREEPSDFKVTATQLYDPSSGQTTPALSLSMKF